MRNGYALLLPCKRFITVRKHNIMAFTLAPLPYAYDALETYIDAQTMQIHHGKHHQAYVDNLNKAIDGTPNAGATLEDLVARAGSISPAVRNNGGGHWNHTFFWESMAPAGKGGNPSAALAKAIDTAFGSFESFKEKFAQAGMTRFGSGWAWLLQLADGSLEATIWGDAADPDADGFANAAECAFGTDPRRPDAGPGGGDRLGQVDGRGAARAARRPHPWTRHDRRRRPARHRPR